MKTNRVSIAIVSVCVICLMLASVLSLTACGTIYHSNPGTKEQMAGTYELTAYTQKDEEGNEIDRIEQLEVKAYMVVGSDGYGYYAYQDKNTEFWYNSTIIEYTSDLEQPELFKAIRITTGNGNVTINKQKPGCGYEPTMGFNVNNNTFSYTIPDYKPSYSWIYPSYYTDVVYSKISDNTDLSTVATKMNRTLNPLPRYELKKLDGALIFHAGTVQTEIDATAVNTEYNKYKYYVVDFHALTGKADIYYELIEGSAGPQVENDVQLDISYVIPSEENGYQNQTVIKFFGKDYHTNLNTYKVPSTYLNYTVWTERDTEGTSYEIYNNYFEKYYGTSQTIADIVAEQLAIYNNANP